MTLFPRILGAATAAYGLVVLVRPRTLAGPVGMVEPDGGLGPGIRMAAGLIGVRDLVAGGWMAVAPAGRSLRTAIVARALFDAGDAALFGTLAPTPEARRKAALVAGAWSALCGLSLLAARGEGAR
jgi:hypothetical protein